MAVSEEKVKPISWGTEITKTHHLSACLWIPKQGWAWFLNFFLSKGDFCSFHQKGVHGEGEKEDFEDELRSKLGEKETHTELKKEKVVLSLEKSCVLRRLAPVFYFTYFFFLARVF